MPATFSFIADFSVYDKQVMQKYRSGSNTITSISTTNLSILFFLFWNITTTMEQAVTNDFNITWSKKSWIMLQE